MSLLFWFLILICLQLRNFPLKVARGGNIVWWGCASSTHVSAPQALSTYRRATHSNALHSFQDRRREATRTGRLPRRTEHEGTSPQYLQQANLTSEVTIGLFVMGGWSQVWVIMLVTSWPITWRGLVTKFAFLWGNKELLCDFWRIPTFAQNHHIRFMWWAKGCSCELKTIQWSSSTLSIF